MGEGTALKKNGKTLQPGKDRLYPSMIFILLFILTFCLSPFSPLYRYNFSPDEVCYKTISLGLLEGKAPYRDLFDHKGPLSYLIYSFGFLISGKANWGAWIVTYLCNAIAYFFTYKTMRLFRDKEHSFLTTLLLMVVCGFCLENVLSNLSKPENMLLAPLMVSTYFFLKECFKHEGNKFEHISHRSMFIIGLMCGAVFMIKLNVCMLYFAFIGCYFLWLLIKKQFRFFFINTGVFLGGIAAVCTPIVIFLACIRDLREFIDVYFIFNLNYSQEGDGFFYLTKIVLTVPGKITITLLLLITILAVIRDHLKKELNKQRIIMLVLAALVFTVLTMPLVCTYFYIVFLPFYLYGADCLASIFMLLAKDEVSRKQIPVMIYIIFSISIIFQIIIAPYVPWKKTDEERLVEAYGKSHPDASVLYFDRICAEMFSDYIPAIPEFRQFYVPPASNADMIEEQKRLISTHQAEVVVFSSSTNENRDASFHEFMKNNNYSQYVAIAENPGVENSSYFFMYVLNEG